MEKLHFAMMYIALISSSHEEIENMHFNSIDFILIGGTGNLAKKYIWPNLLSLKHTRYKNLRLFSCGRSNQVVGESKLQSILQEMNEPFFNHSIQYSQLACDLDYSKFCNNLNRSTNSSLYQRVFYVAIPPTNYVHVLKAVNKFCKCTKGRLKVVLEKPFGHNFASAIQLHQQINEMSNVNVHIADHYLWKRVISHWPIFRDLNDNWLHPMWSSDFIEDISIVLYELEDVNDRIEFYDSCGVIVDILQTHLTQLLVQLIAYKDDLLDHLSNIKPIASSDIYLAQYKPYPLPNSSTPTFSAALIQSSHPRWKNSKFYVKSGKALGIKTSMIGIRFKQPYFKSTFGRWCGDEISHIMMFVSPKPAILIHKRLSVKNFFLLCGPEWNSASNLVIEDLNISNYHVCIPKTEKDDSYERLLNAVLFNEKTTHFLTPKMALMSWLPWKNVIFNTEIKVNSYRKNSNGPQLCYYDDYGWKPREVSKDEL